MKGVLSNRSPVEWDLRALCGALWRSEEIDTWAGANAEAAAFSSSERSAQAAKTGNNLVRANITTKENQSNVRTLPSYSDFLSARKMLVSPLRTKKRIDGLPAFSIAC